jgi:alpha-galactosidase
MTKITIIGGGSYSWGPTFIKDILITPELAGSTIVLHDIDAERLDLVYRLGQKKLGTLDRPDTLQQTLSLDEALIDADFIILTITTGGLDTMRPDLEIPWKYGIRQAVGDTVGPGGLSRALRNIPVLAHMAERVNALCPNAFFLNYTNPLSTLTRTLNRLRATPRRTVGLCHEYLGVRAKLATLFKVKPEQIQARVAGINHFIWISDLRVNGSAVWDQLPGLSKAILDRSIDLDPDDDSVFVDKGLVKATLCQRYGLLPAAGDRHVAEFLPYFITPETDWGAQYGFRLTTADDRAALMADDRALIEAALRDEASLAPFMAEQSGEAASAIIAAVVRGERYIGIMNLPNVGQIANLPRDAVVETFGVIDPTGAQPLAFGALPPAVETLIARHVANQEMIVEAALTGNRALALQVLLNDPLMRGLDVNSTAKMLNEMLEANRAYLPLFF